MDGMVNSGSRLSAALERVADAAIDGNRIVGTVILVTVDGKPAYRAVKGFFDREAGVPMREDAIFRFAVSTGTNGS